MQLIHMQNPPLQIVLFDFQQPTPSSWEEFVKFSQQWNTFQKNQFVVTPEKAFVITLPNGVDDIETRLVLDQLQQLNAANGLIWFVGMQDKRKPTDFEKSDLIEIVGEQYPENLIVNEDKSFGKPQRCEQCGKGSDYDKDILEQPIINEQLLEQRYGEDKKTLLKDIDLIHIPNGGLLASNKVINVLNDNHVKGFRTIGVKSKSTEKVSEQRYLIQAETILLRPCEEHTQVTESGICAACGSILGGLLTYYYIKRSWLNGKSVISRNRLGYNNIYLKNDLYWLLKNKGIKMYPTQGLYICEH
jgi:hypothetical protein